MHQPHALKQGVQTFHRFRSLRQRHQGIAHGDGVPGLH
ncbi:[citrate (pro-3S)-lyase] ligase, partial [Salmonella enterica subsp. enterica serovar Enteritidis]|nr:[citrate (pro-3S)-lyase] ligase [Salmonella enterica]EBQ8894499.1 [citrate (pro-3S)-lyase] ligase [Salmonella enterica subsp. enterica serovar Enteritidis]EBQ9894616.1 [citrate (pro-3S)-lyase] ligase [Salmonella enterica subsp. enterica serovar Hvittingfoss]EBJ9805597.1 [citrate (pro-3S)-lyase] ligase [Salmonella enterica]EBK1113734.1 [citrate (pro-3S)-lyase] ligase [Salmonella enterica]